MHLLPLLLLPCLPCLLFRSQITPSHHSINLTFTPTQQIQMHRIVDGSVTL